VADLWAGQVSEYLALPWKIQNSLAVGNNGDNINEAQQHSLKEL
jgi:hypothetical protein